MPVTTRRRAAALAAVRRSSLKKPLSSSPNNTPRRPSQNPPLPLQITSPKRTPDNKIIGAHRRRAQSLPTEESHAIACRFGHRLYDGRAQWNNAAIISPTLNGLVNLELEGQARFYERKLAQVSADLAATGDLELWKVHSVVDVALGILRGIGKG